MGTASITSDRGTAGCEAFPWCSHAHLVGPNDYVMIHPRGDGWDLMLAAMDRSDLIGDPRFDDEEERVKNSEEAERVITEWTSKRTKWEAMKTLAGSGVLAGATTGAAEVLENEHLIAREMIVNVDDPVRGDYKMVGIPIKLSDEANEVTKGPEVLRTHGRGSDDGPRMLIRRRGRAAEAGCYRLTIRLSVPQATQSRTPFRNRERRWA